MYHFLPRNANFVGYILLLLIFAGEDYLGFGDGSGRQLRTVPGANLDLSLLINILSFFASKCTSYWFVIWIWRSKVGTSLGSAREPSLIY